MPFFTDHYGHPKEDYLDSIQRGENKFDVYKYNPHSGFLLSIRTGNAPLDYTVITWRDVIELWLRQYTLVLTNEEYKVCRQALSAWDRITTDLGRPDQTLQNVLKRMPAKQ